MEMESDSSENAYTGTCLVLYIKSQGKEFIKHFHKTLTSRLKIV